MRFKDTSGGFFHNVVVTVASDATGNFDTCAQIEDGAEDNIDTALVFKNWIQDCENEVGSGGTLSNEPDVGNGPIVVSTTQLSVTPASQASAASPIPKHIFTELTNGLALPNVASGDPHDFDARFF